MASKGASRRVGYDMTVRGNEKVKLYWEELRRGWGGGKMSVRRYEKVEVEGCDSVYGGC